MTTQNRRQQNSVHCKAGVRLGSLLALLVSNSHATAQVTLLDNTWSGVYAGCTVSASVPFAQEFTMPNNGVTYQVASVTLGSLTTIWNSGTPPAQLSLWSDVGGLPGSQLGIIGSQPISSDGDLTIVSAPGLMLAPGQSYIIRFDAPAGDWTLSAGAVGPNSGTASFGQFLEFASTPLPFTADMALTATPVPEPSAVGLAFGAIAACAVLAGRRRRALA